MVRRVDLKRLAEVRDGAVIFALTLVGEAPVGVGEGIFRVRQPDFWQDDVSVPPRDVVRMTLPR